MRRLLIVGAMSFIRWVIRKGGSANRWLATLVMREAKMVAASPIFFVYRFTNGFT